MPERIPTNKARQGRWGFQVLIVLVVALALAAVVWVGLEFYGEAIDTQSTEQPGAAQPNAAQPGTTQPGATEPGTTP
jgi:hypothetical protein